MTANPDSALRQALVVAEKATQQAIIALNDWTCTYASDMCAAAAVAEARERIGRVGTLAYIAGVSADLREAHALITEALQRGEKNA